MVVAGLMGLVVLTAAGPTIVALVNHLVPLILVVGILAAVLRVVWFYTRDR